MNYWTVIILIGSRSDVEQKLGGKETIESILLPLKETIPNFSALVWILSCHRNTEAWLEFIKQNSAIVWIAGAGMASHLPGMTDAVIRSYGRLEHVLGFSISHSDPDCHAAARLSITEIPGKPVPWTGYDQEGLRNALEMVTELLNKPVPEREKKDPVPNFIVIQ